MDINEFFSHITYFSLLSSIITHRLYHPLLYTLLIIILALFVLYLILIGFMIDFLILSFARFIMISTISICFCTIILLISQIRYVYSLNKNHQKLTFLNDCLIKSLIHNNILFYFSLISTH